MKIHSVQKKKRRFTPMRIICASYILLIIFGGTLLFLPFSRASGQETLSYLDCLFTATSAVCVTGLVVVPTVIHWSLFGQIVIILLIQVGGLSIITVGGFLLIVTGRKLGFESRILLQNTFNQPQFGGMAKMAKMVIKGTLMFEGIAAVILSFYFHFKHGVPVLKAIYFGIFHAISAFCNAGFDVLAEDSLISYAGEPLLNIVIMLLIIIGGIGFLVWKDVHQKLKNRKHRLSVNTRIALSMTCLLIFSGAAFFFFLESNNPETIGLFSTPKKILISFFQSVTLRTAGFSSLNQYGLNASSKFISSILMMIGGSPGGMAGGVTTVSLAVIIASIWSTIKGRESIIIMNRSVSLKVLQKALAITGIMVFLLFLATTILSITEVNSVFEHTFLDIMYECASALGTVGVTTGITPYLTDIGKFLLMICMVMGRVGPITAIYAITRKTKDDTSIVYPETDLLIG